MYILRNLWKPATQDCAINPDHVATFHGSDPLSTDSPVDEMLEVWTIGFTAHGLPR